jgi:hypothetical protein
VRKRLILVSTSVLMIALLAFAVLYGLTVRQRSRAQACFHEIAGMQLGAVTFADAQHLAKEYGGEPFAPPPRKPYCSSYDCSLRFVFRNRPLDRLPGVKSTALYLGLNVKDGYVVSREIDYDVETTSAFTIVYILMDGLHDVNNPLHPGARDYDVREGWVDHGTPRLLEVQLTPRSTAEQRDHAYSLNLSCLARAFGCSTESAIFPPELLSSVRNQ